MYPSCFGIRGKGQGEGGRTLTLALLTHHALPFLVDLLLYMPKLLNFSPLPYSSLSPSLLSSACPPSHLLRNLPSILNLHENLKCIIQKLSLLLSYMQILSNSSLCSTSWMVRWMTSIATLTLAAVMTVHVACMANLSCLVIPFVIYHHSYFSTTL